MAILTKQSDNITFYYKYFFNDVYLMIISFYFFEYYSQKYVTSISTEYS